MGDLDRLMKGTLAIEYMGLGSKFIVESRDIEKASCHPLETFDLRNIKSEGTVRKPQLKVPIAIQSSYDYLKTHSIYIITLQSCLNVL